MRIAICGFYGWSCAGDEGILLAIMDSLGTENDYIVYTNLPYTMLENYRLLLPKCVVDVRQIYDVRTDYDAFILGGGGLSWGFGWRQAINAWGSGKPSMNYGVGISVHQLYHPRLKPLYADFLNQFEAVTVRDMHSLGVVEGITHQGIATLTGCPSLNLNEEKFDCPKGMIAVCPRYEDYESNDPQLAWLYQRLVNVADEVLLIPFAPFNTEGVPVDYALCLELQKRLKGSQILNITDASNPRRIKYAISQSKTVVSGGRYHAIVWAAAHGISYETSPTARAYPKIGAFEQMDIAYGSERLKEMEKLNKKIFMEKCTK